MTTVGILIMGIGALLLYIGLHGTSAIQIKPSGVTAAK